MFCQKNFHHHNLIFRISVSDHSFPFRDSQSYSQMLPIHCSLQDLIFISIIVSNKFLFNIILDYGSQLKVSSAEVYLIFTNMLAK